MSRPTTRNKNKRHKPEDDNGIASGVLRKIHLTGEVTTDDIHQLYMIRKPVCQGCRLNSKDNPNCFCGLIPPPNGTRKTGLWQKMSDIILSFGPDPCMELREITETPAGLTNLGATCYANSILQCLYMNTSFREGVFSVESDLLGQLPVLDQLARLFVQLHSCRRAFIDSGPFIKTLALDNGVQQDSHEFLTLLLSLLEQSLSHSQVPKARTIVQDLFVGSVSHVTRCTKCGQESEASSKMEDFYELELNIKGLKTLHDSLEDYLSLEELCGENQYFCESCKARVDATRCIKLRTLPDFLNFQLKRCVFHPKTTTKKKLTSLFSFPGVLDMGQKLCEPSQLELVYDLTAVLIHKGTTVNSGHYVAHIKDERTGTWWEFDDELVTKLGAHPFGEGSSTAKICQPVSDVEPPPSEQIDSLSNGNHTNNDQLKSSENKSIYCGETFSSSDAYMLMYTRRNTKHSDRRCTELNNSGQLISEADSDFLPSHLLEEVRKVNASYNKACEEYDQKKAKELDIIKERREEVRSILSDAPVPSFEEQFFWIATDWLRQWADNVTPLLLDNTPIQCCHGKVPVSKVGLIKRVSDKAWSRLLSKYGGGPTLTDSDICGNCLMDGANTIVRSDDYRSQREAMREIAEDAHAGKTLAGTLYYVSKRWLSQWLRRKHVDFPCEADIGPTASIRCPHGELMPEQAAGAKRVLVPESLWRFLLDTANTLKPDDPMSCSAFPSDSDTCAICSVERTQVACLEDSLRAQKIKQRVNHEKLYLEKKIPLSPGCRYYMLPSSWITKWRSYIAASGKNISSSAEPDSLDSVIDSLKCHKHSKLLERPPDLICKRGAIFQKTSPADGFTIITESDWKFFCDDWEGTEWDGISAEIEFSNLGASKVIGSCEDMPISEAHLGSSKDEVNDELESREPIIKTVPEVCEECVGEKESHKLVQRLQYCNEDISVYFVRGKEVPKSILEASQAISEPDRRISKRSRKTSCGNSINLTVSGSTSIYQLKMMIWESFGVVKENQILHKGHKVIEGESATLADMNIFPGDVLWIKDSEIHENRDIADELSEQKMEIQPTEEGFRGTLLTSNISAQVI
ncbi:hypothetical protein AQUCO_01300891v1 [Aquilegia coerulea]|uniref:Ubiquitin carboxyl-terminal hydrolase 26 n=1 Tax=Aquilegia coerulea TaxID=218851 RepID=A0A2G5E3Z0_AQUCA|nr:hypothetical protein AQUCO_01300891v1 [Aquilegia coerulea]PIA50463.1 hypothetical protein AQUCO_01300891v1 [Aquilegia coerulea]PIA50464.1 hypothetical protein AQUCO_01300891v1 [Aquilegia coerulea]